MYDVTFPGGVAVDVAMNGHTVHTDQPAAIGGGNSAPTPFQLFLASIATCAGFYALRFCQERHIPTEGLGVTKPASRDFIKRVIGLPGETIQITNGIVNIKTPGGRSFSLTEPYINTENRDTSSYGPYTIPANSYFVMGDNRANSADSRTSLGPIKKKVIIGRAFIRIWPIDRFGFFHRPKYPNATAAGLAEMAPVVVLGAGVVVRRRRAA